jgi:hypothetical protein
MKRAHHAVMDMEIPFAVVAEITLGGCGQMHDASPFWVLTPSIIEIADPGNGGIRKNHACLPAQFRAQATSRGWRCGGSIRRR